MSQRGAGWCEALIEEDVKTTSERPLIGHADHVTIF